ncbi:MAG: hypothetical protein IPN03_23065 [Holophagales bacterium]|nr:hypothetical protein [Holophagales bacterium]
MLLKHWRSKRAIARRLIKLGCPLKKAWRTVYEGRRRLWDLSRTAAVQKSLRNEYFEKRGLFSLEAWRRQRWARELAPVQLPLELELG